MDRAEGRWANSGAISLNSLPPPAPCTISHVFCIFFGKKHQFNSPKLSYQISSLLQGVDPEEMGQGKKLSSFV